jgi:crossover junction endodeoxyribonuclease RuvC
MILLGIDVGLRGALALVGADGELLDVHDMPVLADGPRGRAAVNGPLLAEIVFRTHAQAAYIELVGARPGEGPSGAFSFGRSRGIIEGVCAAAGLPTTLLTPPVWRRAVGIAQGAGKDASRSEAIRRWPARADLFARKVDDGRAEACLIAVAGLMRMQREAA